MWIHVQGRIATCREKTHRKGPVSVRGSTSGGVQPRNIPNMAGIGISIHVQERTATCTWQQHREGLVQARETSFRGVQPREQGQNTAKGRYRHVDPRLEAYSHVHKANTSKRAGKGTWINVQRRTATCTGPTHRKGTVQARGSKSKGLQPRAQGQYTQIGR